MNLKKQLRQNTHPCILTIYNVFIEQNALDHNLWLATMIVTSAFQALIHQAPKTSINNNQGMTHQRPNKNKWSLKISQAIIKLRKRWATNSALILHMQQQFGNLVKDNFIGKMLNCTKFISHHHPRKELHTEEGLEPHTFWDGRESTSARTSPYNP